MEDYIVTGTYRFEGAIFGREGADFVKTGALLLDGLLCELEDLLGGMSPLGGSLGRFQRCHYGVSWGEREQP